MTRFRLTTALTIMFFASVGILIAGGQGEAGTQGQTLRVMGGDHLRNVLTGDFVGSRGRNVLTEFENEFGVEVQWVAFPTGDIADVLNRLGPLPRTEEDIIFYTGLYPSQRVAPFFADLKPYIDAKPIWGFPDDYSDGMLEALTIDGKLIGLPYRAGTFALWYNRAIFEERGIDGPPRTPEELYEIAKQATFTRESGEQVFGVVTRGSIWGLQEQLAMWARMWEGDPLSMDFVVGLDEEPVIRTVELWRRMYVEGILPADWATGDLAIDLFRTGRAAMVTEGANYWPRFNDAPESAIRGDARVAHMPLAEEYWTADRDFSRSFAWWWSVAILNGSQNKDLAYDFIEFTSRPDIQLQMTLNENGPPRISTLEGWVDEDPGAKITAEQLPYTAPALPAHDDIGEIIDIMGQAVHEVVVGGRPARATMRAAADRIRQIVTD